MVKQDLSKEKDIDFSEVSLTYEGFRDLAINPYLSPEERIGFPTSYRQGFEGEIMSDISFKMGNFSKNGGKLLDIGCGASPLTLKLIDEFGRKDLKAYLNDSKEMLDYLPDNPSIIKLEGKFPEILDDILKINPDGFDYILCYSVFHYIFLEMNPFQFVDLLMSILKPGGIALIGDIPNISKRKRFFSSENGALFHKNFTNTDVPPQVDIFKIERDQIDDAVLDGMVKRARSAGYNAYILPQLDTLPMHNRRDDFLIQRP